MLVPSSLPFTLTTELPSQHHEPHCEGVIYVVTRIKLETVIMRPEPVVALSHTSFRSLTGVFTYLDTSTRLLPISEYLHVASSCLEKQPCNPLRQLLESFACPYYCHFWYNVISCVFSSWIFPTSVTAKGTQKPLCLTWMVLQTKYFP